MFFNLCWIYRKTTSVSSFYKENNFKPCLTKQLLNMFKLWCEWGISLYLWYGAHAFQHVSNRHVTRHHFYFWESILQRKGLIEESIPNFRSHTRVRGYPNTQVNDVLAQINDRQSALQQTPEQFNAFCNQYSPSVPNLKTILMRKWHLIENHPLLSDIYWEPLISNRWGNSLKTYLLELNFRKSWS